MDSTQIDALLPQTQCRECGYASCKAYAVAIAAKEASIDLCTPGGEATLRNLATLLKQQPLPFLATVTARYRPPAMAAIIEEECIGCTKCIQACPVDAIIGAAKQLHSILTAECTGCGLCVAPCPVDCITLLPLKEAHYDRQLARYRYQARQQRLELKPVNDTPIAAKNYLEAALARAAMRK